MNRLVLLASLAERGALRCTPAGLPALDLQLLHESEVSHEGQARKVALELRALVIGSLASKVASLPLGSVLTVSGFLAPARNGRGILFHITDLAP
ncbi:MAG: primosomal replication protein N [Betaproteobacteria bacterium]